MKEHIRPDAYSVGLERNILYLLSFVERCRFRRWMTVRLKLSPKETSEVYIGLLSVSHRC